MLTAYMQLQYTRATALKKGIITVIYVQECVKEAGMTKVRQVVHLKIAKKSFTEINGSNMTMSLSS